VVKNRRSSAPLLLGEPAPGRAGVAAGHAGGNWTDARAEVGPRPCGSLSSTPRAPRDGPRGKWCCPSKYGRVLLPASPRAFDLRDTDVQYSFCLWPNVLGRGLEWAPILAGWRVCVFRGQSRIKFDPGRGAAHLHGGRAARLREAARSNRSSGRTGECSHGRCWLGLWGRCPVRRPACAGKSRLGSACASSTLWPIPGLSKLRARLGFDRCRFLISGGRRVSFRDSRSSFMASACWFWKATALTGDQQPPPSSIAGTAIASALWALLSTSFRASVWRPNSVEYMRSKTMIFRVGRRSSPASPHTIPAASPLPRLSTPVPERESFC